MKNSTNIFQLIFLVISSFLLRRSSTLVYGLIVSFPILRHVQNICKSYFAQIRDLKHHRGYLTGHAALMTANALVSSRLDYCNSLFYSLSALDLFKLQCVKNMYAFSKRQVLSFFLNEWAEESKHKSLDKSFQIFGASDAKCLVELNTEVAKCGTSSNTPSAWLLRVL